MEIVIRAAVIYLYLFVLTRALGKGTLGALNVFELVTLLLIADVVQPAVTQQDDSLVGGVLAVSTLMALTVLFAWLQRRFPWGRKLIEGQPVIVVRNGEMQPRAMRLERLSESDLLHAARIQGIRDLADVDLAALEVDGQISFFTSNGTSQRRRSGIKPTT